MTEETRAPRTLLRAEGVSISRGRRAVVRDVTMELRAGEIVALLGPNGAGKSTLLDALAGALPVAEGRIERHGRVGIALQSPDLARRTVLANVVAALKLHLDKTQVDELFASLGFAADTRTEQLDVDTLIKLADAIRSVAPDWKL